MAKKVKDYFDLENARELAARIKSVHAGFDSKKFVAHLKPKLETLEFSDRMELFADGLDAEMTGDYTKDLAIFEQILGPELEKPEGMFTSGYWLWPIGRYVRRNGTKDFDASMAFIKKLTTRYTGEFAVRPLIVQHPKKALKIMEKWSRDENVHIRRCASEGLRIKLPWAPKMMEAVNEWDLFKKIMTNLKADPEKFVQKSVGNNLNDLMKEDPDRANEIIDEWERGEVGKATAWIIKHGRRSLKK